MRPSRDLNCRRLVSSLASLRAELYSDASAIATLSRNSSARNAVKAASALSPTNLPVIPTSYLVSPASSSISLTADAVPLGFPASVSAIATKPVLPSFLAF